MTPQTTALVAELRAKREAATPGEWEAKSDRRRWNPNFIEAPKAHIADVMPCTLVDKKNDPEAKANAALIVAAVNALPTLLSALEEQAEEIGRLEAGIKRLMMAYVRLLEVGRDRILDLGGDCDPVDVMEAGDPSLRAARALNPGGDRG